MNSVDYFNQVVYSPELSWQAKVSLISQHYRVDAITAAKMLGPAYKSVDEKQWDQFLSTMLPEHVSFFRSMADIVKNGQMSWPDAVGYIVRESKINLGEASRTLSEFMNH